MNICYPKELSDAEDALVDERRKAVSKCLPDERRNQLGLALSGGGIRSATFCLGVLQTLARTRVLRRVDFLSTVSGGGYIGAFLGTLFQRKAGLAEVEQALSDNHSKELHWLRENGRHLAPNGAGDLLTAIAIQLRNWLAVVTVIGTSFLTFFLGSVLMLRLMGVEDSAVRPFRWWNPWLVPAGATTAIAVMFAWGYWFASSQHYKFFTRHLSKIATLVWLFVCALGLKVAYPGQSFLSVDFWVWARWKESTVCALVFKFGILLGGGAVVVAVLMWLWGSWQLGKSMAESSSGPVTEGKVLECIRQSKVDLTRWLQNRYGALLKICLVLTVCLLAFAILDRLGQALAGMDQGSKIALRTAFAASGLTAVFSFGDKLIGLVQRLTSKKGGGQHGKKLLFSFQAIALLAGLALLFLYSLSLDALAHAIAGKNPGISRELLICFGGCAALALTLGRNLPFLNASSLQYLYGSRLVRAYLGATNDERHAPVTEVVKGDDCWLDKYRPHEKGGPLHLINVTFNETCSGESQLEQRDRKGLQFAVGPAGITVGARYHTLWSQQETEEDVLAIKALPVGDPARDFQMFPRPRRPFPKLTDSSVRLVQRLTLGHWIAISGAAFGTGLGQQSSLGISLLAGLANVRLGYWWDSMVCPSERGDQTFKPTRVIEFASAVFGVQSYLLSEWLCRFHGPARRHWYLSDGGHYENTAVYELLRRRVPCVICCDCGADPEYDFTDVANLVRKARIDFNAEVTFISSKGLLSALEKLEVKDAQKIAAAIGLPEEFNARRTSGHQPHGMLAIVRFPEPWPRAASADDTFEYTLILFLKPALSGDEPLDVWKYDVDRSDFPQESTAEQFFDEAQWESYRKLGEHTAVRVLAVDPAAPDAPAWFLQLKPMEMWKACDHVLSPPTYGNVARDISVPVAMTNTESKIVLQDGFETRNANSTKRETTP